MTLLLIAIAPCLTLGLAVYLKDKYEKEPLGLLLKVYFWGALATIPIIFVELILGYFNIFPGVLSAAYDAFIIAALTEEFFKRRVFVKFVLRNENFNEKLDGIVYAVFISLGFATVENILYVFESGATTGLLRAFTAVPAHALFAVAMGYYFSLAKYSLDEEKRAVYIKKTLLVPVILHGVYDFILMVEIPIVLILFVPYLIYLWVGNLKKLNKYAKESKENYEKEHKEESTI